MEVRSAIQQIALEHAAVTAIDELRRSCTAGMQVNHKRWRGSCEKTTCWGCSRAVRVTTNSNHKLEIYLNLAIV